MNRQNIFQSKLIVLVFTMLLFCYLLLPLPASAATLKVNNEFKATHGIVFKDITYKDSISQNNTNTMEINLSDPYTKVQLGKPDPLNSLETLRAKAKKYNRIGNQVIGAINGGFYNVADRIPVNLISENNKLVFAGAVSSNKNTYVNEPISFGIDANGKAMIDHYQLTLNYTYNGTTYNITGNNKPRKTNDLILYTYNFYQPTTGTNQYGTEVLLETTYQPKFTFGSKYRAKVSAIRKAGDTNPLTIPTNGFVLSGHGTGSDQLAVMNIGDTVEINMDISDPWKGSDFMLAGGPQLVKDGKVNMTINPSSFIANEVAPRTAVAVDKTGKRVYFITVDGRQGDKSPGMSLKQFAEYLVSLGVDRALNLDGGGSTLMAVRYPGETSLKVANKPSDGFERGVSTILMAVDTEPTRIFSDVSYRDSHYEGINWLKGKGITGYEDNTFRGDSKLSRQHAAIMFSKSLGLELPKASVVETLFKDVTAQHVYADYIAAVGKGEIFTGNKGNFNPNQMMTREQMATTLVNAYGLKDNGSNKKVNLTNVDPSHKKSVQILANLGITNQLDNFRPNEPVTRAQFATFLYRASMN
jgi:uncharacterized protein YigE (DUF2233 family)